MTEFSDWFRDWREKIVRVLGNGRNLFDTRKKVYPEFSEKEVEYLDISLEILYCNNKYNDVIFDTDVFHFYIKNAYSELDFCMQVKFRVLYGYVIRCQSPYFCFSENDFQRLCSFVYWRHHVISSYCLFKFNCNGLKLPANAISYFDILQRLCSGYKNAPTMRERLLIMSSYFYFLTRLVSFVKVQRELEFKKREE